ncbi:MAG: hypothetical protein ACLF0G_11620 [Candidatus Brocadiia bacterium]
MLKKLNLLVALAVVVAVGVIVVAMSRGVRTEGWELRGKELHIYGPDYTLARLAREIDEQAGDVGEVLLYDPEQRRTEAKVSLIVHGGLQVGDPDDEALGELLVLDTVVCGDLRVEVTRRGSLGIYHSTVTTKSETLTVDQCSQGYALRVDGRLEARDSYFLYMSGSASEVARRTSRIVLHGVTFADCDGSAFQAVEADGSRLDIRESKFQCAGYFGVVVDGLEGEPVRLVDSQLYGKLADLALRGQGAEVELLDCRFSRGKIKFYQAGGSAAILWTTAVRVVEEGTGRPLPGVRVVATSTGARREVVEGTTEAEGRCSLVLTEYVATTTHPVRVDGHNNCTPHRIEARRGGRVLAAEPGFDACYRDATLTLEVPAAALAAAP